MDKCEDERLSNNSQIHGPTDQEQRIREHERHELQSREVRLHVNTQAERLTPEQVRHSASGRTPKRTHRVVQRIDRILQGSLGRARVSLV